MISNLKLVASSHHLPAQMLGSGCQGRCSGSAAHLTSSRTRDTPPPAAASHPDKIRRQAHQAAGCVTALQHGEVSYQGTGPPGVPALAQAQTPTTQKTGGQRGSTVIFSSKYSSHHPPIMIPGPPAARVSAAGYDGRHDNKE